MIRGEAQTRRRCDFMNSRCKHAFPPCVAPCFPFFFLPVFLCSLTCFFFCLFVSFGQVSCPPFCLLLVLLVLLLSSSNTCMHSMDRSEARNTTGMRHPVLTQFVAKSQRPACAGCRAAGRCVVVGTRMLLFVLLYSSSEARTWFYFKHVRHVMSRVVNFPSDIAAIFRAEVARHFFFSFANSAPFFWFPFFPGFHCWPSRAVVLAACSSCFVLCAADLLGLALPPQEEGNQIVCVRVCVCVCVCVRFISYTLLPNTSKRSPKEAAHHERKKELACTTLTCALLVGRVV